MTPAREEDLAHRFAEALTGDDIDGLLALLTSDAWLAMPPAPHEYKGHAAIAAFWHSFAAYRGPRRFHLVPTHANAQPAFGCYIDRPGEPVAGSAGLFVLTIEEEGINRVAWFIDDDCRRRFDLPDTLPSGSTASFVGP